MSNGASLSGFTLSNGAATGSYGGGVLCESATAVVSNCVLTGNRASSGGGASGGTLNNCTLKGNSASWYCCFGGGYGGGASGSTLNNCTLTGNSATGYLSLIFYGGGGGAAYSVLNNCLLSNYALRPYH